VKIAALSFLIIANFVAGYVLAADFSIQPLTRSDCDKTDMTWDDNANVCGGKSFSFKSEAVSEPVAEATATNQLRQPLTRASCDAAGMVWNDNANVCGTQAEGAASQTAGAPDTLSQPLTRATCGKAGMNWNDNANVCGTNSKGLAPQAVPETFAAEVLGQPLTRADCGKAGLAWDEGANVCGSASEASNAQPQRETFTTAIPNQPLTKMDCGNAGMAWNDRSNVCGASEESKVLAAPMIAPKANIVATAATAANTTKKRAKNHGRAKSKYAQRRGTHAESPRPVERPFRLFFRNQNRAAGG
jgi:hypothetical protein